jgi:hypothetical protein
VSSNLNGGSVAFQPRLSFSLLSVGVESVPLTLSTHLPSKHSIQEGVEMFRRTGTTSITVVGNGAAVDTAKAIAHKLGPQTRTPLIFIPTTISPVACYDAWNGLHAEDDVLLKNLDADAGGGTTTVLFDPGLLTDQNAYSSFISPLVSAAYLLSHVIDSVASMELQGRSVNAPDGLAQTLAPALASAPGPDSGPGPGSVEALCLAAVSAGAFRNDGGLHGGAFVLEQVTQLSLLRAGGEGGRVARGWPFSWLSVLSLQALLRTIEAAEGREAQAVQKAIGAVCSALALSPAAVRAGVDQAALAVRTQAKSKKRGSSSGGDVSVGGMIEGVLMSLEEHEKPPASSDPQQQRNILALNPDSGNKTSSPTAALLQSDFFLDLATDVVSTDH